MPTSYKASPTNHAKYLVSVYIHSECLLMNSAMIWLEHTDVTPKVCSRWRAAAEYTIYTDSPTWATPRSNIKQSLCSLHRKVQTGQESEPVSQGYGLAKALQNGLLVQIMSGVSLHCIWQWELFWSVSFEGSVLAIVQTVVWYTFAVTLELTNMYETMNFLV